MYRELTIRITIRIITISTYTDGYIYTWVSIYTPLWNQFAIGVDTLAKRFSNIPLWCSARFYRACRLLRTQDGNYTRPSRRVWKAWLKATSHETINKKITSDCWWRIHERKNRRSKETRLLKTIRSDSVLSWSTGDVPLPFSRNLMKIAQSTPREKVPLSLTRQKLGRGETATFPNALSRAGDWICRCVMNIHEGADVILCSSFGVWV